MTKYKVFSVACVAVTTHLKVNLNGNTVSSNTFELMEKAVENVKDQHKHISLLLAEAQALNTCSPSSSRAQNTCKSKKGKRKGVKLLTRMCVLTVKGCLVSAHPSDGVEQTVSHQ